MRSKTKLAAIWPARSVFGLAFLMSSVSVLAEDEPPRPGLTESPIDQIVVVAHKDERSIRDVAANVTVMSREDIDSNLSITMSDVFRYTPGIDYEAAGARFGDQGINIRGIGGNRVAMLVDGVPLGDQYEVGSFSNATRDFIDAGLIERLEVLHGPASALYGSAAIGGVVAVRTPDPADFLANKGSGGDLLATWRDADGSMQGTGMIAFGDASMGLLLGGSMRSGEQSDSAAVEHPFDLRDFERNSGLLKFVADDGNGNTWRAGVIHQDARVTSDLNSMLGTGRYRSTTALEGDDEYELDLLNVAYEFGSPEAWIDSGVVRGYVERTSVRQSTLDERGAAARPVAIDRYFQFDQDIDGLELNLHKNYSSIRTDHRLGFGIEYRQRRTTEYRDGLERGLLDGQESNVILGEEFPLRDFPVSDSIEWGAYVEDVVSIGDWSIIAALRADRYDLNPQSDPMYAEDYPFAEPVALSESDLSPKLGVIYHIGESTDLYLQYAHGFRAPPYEDANIGLEVPAFNYRAIPNPDLKSESSDGFELGLRWQGQYKRFTAGLFRTRYEDFIESRIRLGEDPVSGRILFQSQNINRTLIEGFEAGWQLNFDGALQNFSTDGAVYKARGKNEDNGQPLNSVGPGQAVLGARWTSSDELYELRLQATLTESWSDRDDTGGALFEPPGYALFDFFYTQHVSERMSLRAGLSNIADLVYWNWSEVRGLSPDDPVIPYLAQTGRSMSLSLNLRW